MQLPGKNSGNNMALTTAAGGAEGAPTSTSKALLLFIHVPLVHRIFISNEEEESEASGEDEKRGSSEKTMQPDGSSVSFASLRIEKALTDESSKEDSETREVKVAENVTKSEDDHVDDSTGEHDIGYVETDERVEHVVTVEEMATIVKLNDKSKGDEEAEEIAEEKKEETPTLKDTVMKAIFGVTTHREDETKTTLNREQAIQAMKEQVASKEADLSSLQNQRPAPNTEIKVQALLKLTCKNLFKEGCFYTAPTITSITKGEEEDAWIQFTIMVKPNFIGLVLERLERIGVGSSVGMISIYKTELLRTADWPVLKENEKKKREISTVSGKKKIDGVNVEDARKEWKNAACRLRVEQVKEQIQEQAAMSFDFAALLIIACILAGIGLITNSTVVIVASMLVSPIMGPVMGMTFGSRVLDWRLTRSSAINEVGSLVIAILVGLVIGFASSWTPEAENWPTDEMKSRGDITGLITGIAIAVPSGMGVALSILGNNTSSLVGVAISASLLPPAVNAGICWAHAILISVDIIENPENFAEIGVISFALTGVNIVCIWISGILMFAIKEVAPSKSKSAFWSHDIKVARAIQKGGTKDTDVDMETIKAGLQDALEQKKTEEKGTISSMAKLRRRVRRRKKSNNFSFNLADDPMDEDDYLEYFMLGLNPLIEGAHSLEMDERAAYLGFHASLQEFEVEDDSGVVGDKPAFNWGSLLFQHQ